MRNPIIAYGPGVDLIEICEKEYSGQEDNVKEFEPSKYSFYLFSFHDTLIYLFMALDIDSQVADSFALRLQSVPVHIRLFTEVQNVYYGRDCQF